jgi:uncharacterized protein (TIGR02246 family)
MQTEEQKIRRVMDEWHRRTAEGDLDAILALMADDAVFLRCGGPPMNKKEFAEGFRQWSARGRIESKYDVKDIHASGDVAYVWSYISIVMISKDAGSTKREGNVLSVFRKSPSGGWLLARDANLMTPV